MATTLNKPAAKPAGAPPRTSAQSAPGAARPVQGARPAPRPRLRRITRREAREAAARLKTDDEGRRIIVRFSLGQRLEHQFLMVTFTLLTVTGLAQRFAANPLGALTLTLFGGIETARQIHHLAAAVFILESVYHVGVFAYGVVVYRRWGSMWPTPGDLAHFFQMLRLNLGLSKQPPYLGRYTFEEKAEYWALVWGGAVMILTGFIQWFPTLVSRWLPGAAIPVARAMHSWEAVLAALAILTWHLYHAVLKHFNKSIFTGTMTEEEMLEEHPAELAYLERAAAAWARSQQARSPEPASPPGQPAARPAPAPPPIQESPTPRVMEAAPEAGLDGQQQETT